MRFGKIFRKKHGGLLKHKEQFGHTPHFPPVAPYICHAADMGFAYLRYGFHGKIRYPCFCRKKTGKKPWLYLRKRLLLPCET